MTFIWYFEPLFIFCERQIESWGMSNMSFRKFIFCFFCILGISIISQAQAIVSPKEITGQLVDEFDRPISFLTVRLLSNDKTSITSRLGFFTFKDITIERDSLILDGVGFKHTIYLVNLESTISLSLGKIKLGIDFTPLPGIEITGRSKSTYKSDYSFVATKMQTPVKDIPQAISTITEELFKDRMRLHLNEAIADAPGINLYSGNDEYSIRGFKAENAHLINGMRTFNSTLISPLLVNIDRIEVIKGPTSVLYGNADPGGNINLVTKKPLLSPMTKVDLWSGSFRTYRVQADMTGPLSSNGKWLYRANTGYEDAGSFRNGLFKKIAALAPSFTFIPNDRWQVNADFSFQHARSVVDRGQPGLLNNKELSNTPIGLSVIQPGDHLSETNGSGIISATHKVNNHFSFNSSALVHVTSQDISEHGINSYLSDDSVSLYYMKRNYNAFVVSLNNYASLKFNVGKTTHELLAGYDFTGSIVDITRFNGELSSVFGEATGVVGTFSLRRPTYTNRLNNLYKQSIYKNNDPVSEEYSTHGVYVQEQANLGQFQFLLSMRYTLYAGDEEDSASAEPEHVFLPRLGIVYKVNQDVNLYATYNKGFDPFERSFFLQLFKDPFKPLYSELFETGVKADLLDKKISASLALYRLRVKNIAVNANDPINPDLYIQRGMDQSNGMEAEFKGNISPNLSVALSYAWNVSRIKKSTNAEEVNRIKENAPIFSGSSWLKYTIGTGKFKGVNFSVGHSHQSSRNTLTNGLTLPAFVVAQAGIGYTYKKIKVGLNLDNIFNTNYWVGGYNYASKWPGMPRNVMCTVGYKF